MSSKALRFGIPLGISAVLLILVIRSLGDEVSQLPAALAAADWRLIPPAVLLYFCGVWLRSVRWGVLLPAYSVRTAKLFQSLVVGFTVNNLLPLRMGEVARAYLLARWCGVPYGATVASLVVERVLDGLSLAVLLLVSLTLLPAPGYLLVVGILAGGGFFTGATLLAVAAWRASALSALAAALARFLPARPAAVLTRLADSFASSLALVHDPARLARLLGLSILAWCFELGLFFLMLISFHFPTSYPLALLVGSAANFATLVPSSPGYVGTFDAVLTRVLQDTVGIATAEAAAYDVVVHVALFLPVVIVGMLVLWRAHMSFTQITHSPSASTVPASGGDWQPV